MVKKAYFAINEEKRSEMEITAMKLYVDMPYEDITLKVLLDALGLHPGSFYRCFDDKDDYYLYLKAKVDKKIDDYLKEKYPNYRQDIFTFYDDDEVLTDLERSFNDVMMRVPNDVLLRLFISEYKNPEELDFINALRRYRFEGRLRPETDDELMAFMYTTTLFNLVLFCKEKGITDIETLNQLTKYYYMNCFRHGVLKDSEQEKEGE